MNVNTFLKVTPVVTVLDVVRLTPAKDMAHVRVVFLPVQGRVTVTRDMEVIVPHQITSHVTGQSRAIDALVANPEAARLYRKKRAEYNRRVRCVVESSLVGI